MFAVGHAQDSLATSSHLSRSMRHCDVSLKVSQVNREGFRCEELVCGSASESIRASFRTMLPLHSAPQRVDVVFLKRV